MIPGGWTVPAALGAWALVPALLAASGVAFRAAAGAWSETRLLASAEVCPDGQRVRLPALPDPGRYDAWIQVRGTVRSRFTGVVYDGARAASPDGTSWAHGCLQLSPGEFTSAPEPGMSHTWRFVPRASNAVGPLQARLDLAPVAEDMLLPAGARGPLFDGALRMEVRQRDRVVTVRSTGLLGIAGLLLLTGSIARGLWLIRRRSRRNAELEAALMRIRKRRRYAAGKLKAAGPAGHGLLTHVDALSRVAEKLVSVAAEYARAGEQDLARDAYREHVERLNEIERTLALLPARMADALAQPAGRVANLTAAMETEVRAVSDAALTLERGPR